MNTKIFIGIAPPEKMYNFEHVEVTCPTKKPNNDQLKLLQFFNEEGLKSVTPGGKWLIDTEYNYTTLIFKPADGEKAEDTLSKVKDIIDINFFHTFKITTESVNESVDATTIDSINDYVKNVFMSHAGVESQPMNIIYDTTVDVETGEMKVCAFTTPDATENDTKYLKDIFKSLKDEFSKRSDIENVKSNYSKENNVYNLEFKFKGIEKPEDAKKSEKEKKAETELPKIEKPKDENSTETKELEPTKFKTERLAKATRATLKKLFENEDEPSTEDLVDNAVSIELWPAVLPDGSLATVVANSLNVEDSDFEEGCKKLREKQLLITDEDDDETLASDFNTDAFVVIRAPESVEEEGLFDWIDTVGQTLEAVGFDVTVNMEEDTDPSEFEQIEEPELDIEEPVKEADETTQLFTDEYFDKYEDFKSGKMSKSDWEAYCAKILENLMKSNSFEQMEESEAEEFDLKEALEPTSKKPKTDVVVKIIDGNEFIGHDGYETDATFEIRTKVRYSLEEAGYEELADEFNHKAFTAKSFYDMIRICKEYVILK